MITHLNELQQVKQCPMCKDWFTFHKLYNDPDIVPIGICFLESHFGKNAFFFNHEVEGCNTTFSVKVELLKSYIEGAIPIQKVTGKLKCEGRCLDLNDHTPCSQECHYAPYRQLLIKMIEVKSINRLDSVSV